MTPERRAIIFIIFALSCFVPFATLFVWYDKANTLPPQIGYYQFPLIAYVIGVVLYVQRWPESWSTVGKFDIFGGSH